MPTLIDIAATFARRKYYRTHYGVSLRYALLVAMRYMHIYMA